MCRDEPLSDRLRILHVITGLEVGGAETALFRLLGRLDVERHECRVISLTTSGPLAGKIRELGIDVEALEMKRNPLRWFRLIRSIRRWKPDVVQTWLYHADLLGGLAARLAGNRRVIWSVRHANLDPESNESSVMLLTRLLALVSGWLPRRILYNSEAARWSHEARGYAADRAEVLRNGIDTAMFRPDATAHDALARELGCPPGARFIGLTARLHPQKDHATFLRAASRITRAIPEACFVLCGRGVVPGQPALAGWISESGLAERVHLLGPRDDVPRILAALDLAVSSSLGESFPNAVGEAMACGVPCVATAVGDTAVLIGDTGRVVPSRDPVALGNACVQLLEQSADERKALGSAARQRIDERFSIDRMVAAYAEIYRNTATDS